MRAVFGIVLVVGVALAGGATMMVKDRFAAYKTALAQERSARVENIPTVEIYVANEPLKYGQKLLPDAVRMVRWPKESLPEGTFQSTESLFPPDRPEDKRVVLREMEIGEAILAVKVTKPGEEAGITSRLARGMRAFAIKVDVASGVSGFLRPSDRVDIYWTGDMVNGAGQAMGEVTRLIQSNIELVAVDQKAGNVDGTVLARTVTVSVKPEQVAALAQAQSTGRLSLALVGAEDDTIASVIEIDQRKLLGVTAQEAPVIQPEEKVCTIKNRRGTEVITVQIPCTN
ncbi:Flp pilus assembly protein CpaB [Epibacterium sp. SM1969]|uniref:Flp pilus assembly protein CpaB n=1 Tax=Tritonibacter aquimaris TaxID=2663379 RepID=A0A844ATI6_9RHOB|nr:Flp pilus assembly protein CpaB [Tritonibacter aquimaris]MQY43097.1 Flp pilus assembly protein CpaB [Tritonibacter aquimaris]